MASPRPTAVPTQPILEGSTPLPLDSTTSDSATHWNNVEFLGQNKSDGRIYIYFWKCRIEQKEETQHGYFTLHVYSLHPILKVWKKAFEIPDIEVGPLACQYCQCRSILSIDEEISSRSAAFDSEGKKALFWLRPCHVSEQNPEQHLFVLYNFERNQHSLFTMNMDSPYVEKWREFRDNLCGFSEYHENFVYLTLTLLPHNPVDLWSIVLNHETQEWEYRQEEIDSFPQGIHNVYFYRTSVGGDFVAVLTEKNLLIYRFTSKTWTSFQVVGLPYGRGTVELEDVGAIYDSTGPNYDIDRMENLGNSSFIFSQVCFDPHQKKTFEQFIQISPSDVDEHIYEATHVCRWQSPSFAGEYPEEECIHECTEDEKGCEYPTRQNNIFLRNYWKLGITAKSTFWKTEVKCQSQKHGTNQWIRRYMFVEIPILADAPSAPEKLSVLVTRKVGKCCAWDFWERQPTCDKIAEALGIPEMLVKKYFE